MTAYAVGIGESEHMVLAIEEALSAHLKWRRQFVSSITGSDGMSGVSQADIDEHCPLDYWLAGLIVDESSTERYDSVMLLHRRFHDEASRLLDMRSASPTIGEQWSRMDQASDEFTSALEVWRNDLVNPSDSI